jgi:hypothetical protein
VNDEAIDAYRRLTGMSQLQPSFAACTPLCSQFWRFMRNVYVCEVHICVHQCDDSSKFVQATTTLNATG